MFCSKCGASVAEGNAFCGACGNKMEEKIAEVATEEVSVAEVVETPAVETPVVETPVVETPVVEAPVVETPVVEAPVVTPPPHRMTIPKKYEPISAWGFFFYEVLFAIPVIGQIFLLIFALGGARKKNLVNFARSYFCALLVLLIVALVAAIVGIVLVLLGVMSLDGLINLLTSELVL